MVIKVMRLSRFYLCILLNLLGFTVWVLLWEQSRLRLLENAKLCGDHHRIEEDVSSKDNTVNGSDIGHPVTISKRPLLVRFDWYSRKQTPVHIGYATKTTDVPYFVKLLNFDSSFFSSETDMLEEQLWLFLNLMALRRHILMTG